MLRQSRHRAGFTLIELLVVLALIAILTAILLPALRAGRQSAHDLRCRGNYRDVLTEFRYFADDTGAGTRGDSDRLGPDRFRIEDFQERIYRIDEFWDAPEIERLQLRPQDSSLMCPAGPAFLERRAMMPCSAGAVGPQPNVSTAFNMRLHKRSDLVGGRPVLLPAFLTSKVLDLPDTPLLFDVDGPAAVGRAAVPYYAAPPVAKTKSPDVYASGAFWFPSVRHRMRMNVGFVGGHVLSTRDPLAEPWWRWDYQP